MQVFYLFFIGLFNCDARSSRLFSSSQISSSRSCHSSTVPYRSGSYGRSMSSSLRLQSGCFDGLLVLPPLVLQLLLALARPLFASGSCFGFLQALTVVVDPGSSGSSPPSPPVFLQNGFHYHYFIIKICLREYFIANRERERDIQQTKTKQTSNSLKH